MNFYYLFIKCLSKLNVVQHLVLFISILFTLNCFSQSVIDELSNSADSQLIPDLATENIKKISKSRRIFLITNESQSFAKGDYISIVLMGKIAARAIAVKFNNNLAGIKIIKIHSLNLWKQLREDTRIQIVRGDDSYFKNIKTVDNEERKEEQKIQEESDLFSETDLNEDELGLDDSKNRSIKNDNLITGAYATVQRNGQFSGQWAYQIEDNIWIEATFGQSLIVDFPVLRLDTKLTNFVARGKYTIPAPFYSYIQPYLGYQIIQADSPGAGQADSSSSSSPSAEELQQEIDDVAALELNSIIFGVSLLKRLVPGWFIKLDVGTDGLYGGFSLEF